MNRTALRLNGLVVTVAALLVLSQPAAFAATYTLRQGDDYARVDEGAVSVQDKECDFHTAYVRARQLRSDGSVARTLYAEDDSCHGSGVKAQWPLLGSLSRWQLKVCETHPGDDSCTSWHDIPRAALR